DEPGRTPDRPGRPAFGGRRRSGTVRAVMAAGYVVMGSRVFACVMANVACDWRAAGECGRYHRSGGKSRLAMVAGRRSRDMPPERWQGSVATGRGRARALETTCDPPP